MPFIKAFKEMVRRRPFLVQRLEEVLKKLLTSCEFFDDDGRKKIAISAPPPCIAAGAVALRRALRNAGPCAVTTLVFTEKLGVLPDRVFEAMFNDRLVAKGTILEIITEIFSCYMRQTKGGADDLVALLSKAKVADRLLEYFPPGQQTEAAFTSHFEKAGMPKLVRAASPAPCPCVHPVHRIREPSAVRTRRPSWLRAAWAQACAHGWPRACAG